MSWLSGHIIGPIGILAGALAAIIAAYIKGQRAGAKQADARRMRDYVDTRERIDNAENEHSSDDDGALRDSLRARDRGKR